MWREIHGGYYEVSDLGNVRRAKPGHATFVGRPVLLGYSGSGYASVHLGGSSVRRAYVHHLVAEAFIGARPAGAVVNHIDANKTNNALRNLEYVSARENVMHGLANVVRRKGPTKPVAPKPGRPTGDRHWMKRMPERIARGSAMPHCKLTPDDVRNARQRAAAGEQQKIIAAELGISVAQMSRIIRGLRWTYV